MVQLEAGERGQGGPLVYQGNPPNIFAFRLTTLSFYSPYFLSCGQINGLLRQDKPNRSG